MAKSAVSDEVLNEGPARALKLLRGFVGSSAVHSLMAAHHYTEADHLRGCALLQATYVYRPPPVVVEDDSKSVRLALDALDLWMGSGYRVLRTTLKTHFPELGARVLGGIVGVRRFANILSVAVLLDRLDALETSAIAEEQAALVLLASRGIDSAQRAKLRTLVEDAKGFKEGALPSATMDIAAIDIAKQEQQTALVALRGWVDEWSAIARVAIQRRDLLIGLGLAKRKAKAPSAESKKTVKTRPA